jgi:hypothetical protein
VLDTPEPLRNLAELIAAQVEFHKKAYEILADLQPVIDQLQVDQEVRIPLDAYSRLTDSGQANYRKSREGA